MEPAGTSIPIFPLSNVVLFPRIQTPLHVFEPRYRQMTEAALEGDRRIGMVTVRPEHLDDLGGDPPVFPVGCAGEICEAARLPDGRYNLVLLGTHRFRIVREPARTGERLYRVAEIAALADAFDPDDAPRVGALRERIVEIVRELVERERPGGASLSPRVFRGVDDVTFVNALANAFPLPPPEKQGLLETDTVVERFERLLSALHFHLAARAAGGTADPGVRH